MVACLRVWIQDPNCLGSNPGRGALLPDMGSLASHEACEVAVISLILLMKKLRHQEVK